MSSNPAPSAVTRSCPKPLAVSSGWIWAVLDHLFLMRPMLLVPVWTVALLGYHRASVGHPRPDGFSLIWSLSLFSLLVGGIYIHNQLNDLETDRLNGKLVLLPQGYVSTHAAVWQMAFCFALALGFGFGVSPRLGVLLVVSVGLGFLYNARPFRWKDRPLLGLLANALGPGMLAFMVGWSTVQSDLIQAIPSSLPYVLAVGAIALNTTLPDEAGDRMAAKITMSVWLGFKRTVALGFLLMVGASLSAAIVTDWLAMVCALIVLPLYGGGFWFHSMRAVMLSIKVGILALTLGAGLLFPWYGPLVVVTISGCRLYHLRRLGRQYPTL